MRRTMPSKRVMLPACGLVLLALCAGALYYASRLISLGAAYKAKVLCSGVFVGMRDPAAIRRTDLAAVDLPILGAIDTTIDYGSKRAAADFFGIITRQAQFRPGLGCTLVYDSMEDLSADAPAGAGAAAEGVAPGRNPSLDAALQWAFSEPDPSRLRRTRAVVVVQQGGIVAERYASGFGVDTPVMGWSMTKSVVNALAGAMVHQGRLALDGPLPVPEWQAPQDPRRGITLDHLLRMSSGLRFGENYSSPLQDATRMLFGAPDTAAYAAAMPLEATPGTRWSYSSGTTNIISRLIRHVLGEAEYAKFPQKALFRRIGMHSAIIEPDASGTFVGSSFMYATARDWARFGQLYLQDGVWAGQRILPQGWVQYTATPAPQAPDQQYGAHFWRTIPQKYRGGDKTIRLPDGAFHAVGYGGQFVTIIPSRRVVIVRLGHALKPSAWAHDQFLDMVLEALGR